MLFQTVISQETWFYESDNRKTDGENYDAEVWSWKY